MAARERDRRVRRPALLGVLAVTLVGFTAAAVRSDTPPAALDRPAAGLQRLSVPDGNQVRPVLVFRPPVPDSAAVPVVYFLHGTPGTAQDALSGGVVAATAASARAGHPVVLAAPDGTGSRPDTEWADSADGRDRLESFVAGPLIAAVEGRHRRPASRRALLGFSMGGYGAANIALHHPALFGGFGAVSGYFAVDDPDEAFGSDSATEQENTPQDNAAAWAGHWAVLVEGSAEPLPLVRGQASRMAGLLRTAGASVTLQLVPGGHDIHLVGAALPAVVARLESAR